jgi:hypothetical protein
MTQLHKRFTDDQVKVLLEGYGKHLLTRSEVQEILGVGKTRCMASNRVGLKLHQARERSDW